MKIIGWIFGLWLIASIIHSFSRAVKAYSSMKSRYDPLGIASKYIRNMLIIQAIKIVIVILIFRWLLF